MLGAVVAIDSLFADAIGIGSSPGIVWQQLLGTAIGVIVALVGVWLAYRKPTPKLQTFSTRLIRMLRSELSGSVLRGRKVRIVGRLFEERRWMEFDLFVKKQIEYDQYPHSFRP
jgi:hypothetical protein